MPTWRELIEKIETEEQARGFVQAIRGYAIKNHNALREHMESLIREDYKVHPDRYIDEKTGKPYTAQRLESKLEGMIIDERPEELFDKSTRDRLKLYSHFIQATSYIEQAFNMGDYQQDFTDGMLNEYGRNDMQKLLGNALDDYEALVTEYAEIYSEIKTEAMWTVAPRLNTNASNAFMQINDVMGSCIGLWEKGSEGEEAFLNDTVARMPANVDRGSRDAYGKEKLTFAFDQECKRKASELRKQMDEFESNHAADEAHPHVQAFKEGLADMVRVQTDALQSGIDLIAAAGPRETGYWGLQTFIPQFNTDMMKPENADRFEKALAQYPLDEFFRKGNEIQRLKNDYVNNEKTMTQDEKDAYRVKMGSLKEDMLGLCRKLHGKSLEPTTETLSLFGKPGQLTSVESGFIGKRGLDRMIGDLSSELARTPVPQENTDALDAALAKFNTARSGIFKKESDEHIRLRESAEKIRDNLNKLKSGMKDTPDGARPMTSDEKQDLLAETIDKLNTVSRNADAYIGHSEKNGKAPSTSAGKERLDGAKELKDLTNTLQDALMREQQIEAKRAAVRIDGQKVNKLNLSGLEAKEGKDVKEEERKSSKSVSVSKRSLEKKAAEKDLIL